MISSTHFQRRTIQAERLGKYQQGVKAGFRGEIKYLMTRVEELVLLASRHY